MNKEPIKLSIIGASGLTGKELISYLKFHTGIRIVHITSSKEKGKSLKEVFPDISYPFELTFKDHSELPPRGSLVVLAVPNETSLEMTPKLLKDGYKVLDISGAYRLSNTNTFKEYYQLEHSSKELLSGRIFGLPELYREQIKGANFVSNPGCYPTSVIVLLKTLIESNNISKRVIIDSKSGVSGAGGRTDDITFAYTHVSENFRAYKILKHQHEPEILEFGLNEDYDLIFTPHLLPLYRGILSTTVVELLNPNPDSLYLWARNLEKEPFIRYLPNPEDVELKKVANTNFLDFSFRVRGNTLVIVSAIDNLGKGASGQALQNINLMLGFPETMGFSLPQYGE
jgi:N-acetyl-gamma-glutamyl-phosphate reductase